MLRVFIGALRRVNFANIQRNSFTICNRPVIQHVKQQKDFTTFSTPIDNNKLSLLSNPQIIQIAHNIPSRSLTKFSWGKGKRKSVKAVLKRFYRLDWGGWIRTKCGRSKKLWRKTSQRKRRLRQHVLCNASQSLLLDKMVGSYWRKPKYYVDDPYEPYHTREEFNFTYRKPKPYVPNN